MAEASNQQPETTVVQMDDTASEESSEVLDMDEGSSGETPSSRGVLAVPHTAGNFTNEVDEFMPAWRRCVKNIEGKELTADEEATARQIISDWNSFLQPEQGVRGTFAIISSDINKDIIMFIRLQEVQRGAQYPKGVKGLMEQWLPRWNMFLEARADTACGVNLDVPHMDDVDEPSGETCNASVEHAGETLVTRVDVFLTIVGFLLYIVDLGSDFVTAIIFASNGQWWQAIVTLAIVYAAVIIHTAIKWQTGEIHCTGAADWLCYVASLLVNWPDLELYGVLCLLEWKLYKSPVKNAHLAPEWDDSRVKIALLKFSEGVYEACPQASLQLYLLVPDLYGAWTWTNYLRIAGACVSLCTAGAALVNWEKFMRITTNTDVPLRELVVLYLWAVPVTVSRLLSLGFLLSVHPYWALAGVALHLVLYGVYRCRTEDVPCALDVVIAMCLETLQFFLSPFDVAYSIKYRRVSHAIHFLVNTAATVVWALGTPLVCAHPALYTVIICVNAVMFAVGLVGWQLHEKHWPDSYRKYNN